MSQRMVTCSGVGLSRFVEPPSPFGVGAIAVVCVFVSLVFREVKESWRVGSVLYLYSWVSIRCFA